MIDAELLLSDEEVARLTPAELAAYEQTLEAEAEATWARAWRAGARPEQVPPDTWDVFFLRGGRGSGKSWAATRVLVELIADDPLRASHGPGRWAIVAPTFGDARDKCVESEESGLLAALGTSPAEVDAGRSRRVVRYNRSLGEVYLRDGTVVHLDGADDGAYRIQGHNLRGALCDEVGLWRRWETAWDESLGYALRKGQARRVVSGTPKRNMPARELVRRLLDDPGVVSRRLRTEDNRGNLSDAFWRSVSATAGSTLGRQELEGELLEDIEGALWRREWIDDHRVQAPPRLRRVVVALDPADGSAAGDEQAMAVVGLGTDRRLYLLESHGQRTSPLEWLRRAVERARAWDATIVIEANAGGRALADLLEQAMAERGVRVAYHLVHARQDKLDRAAPVAMLAETGMIHHVGRHDVLEEQLVTYNGAGKSPDRLDAFVHGVREIAGTTGAALRDASAESAGAVPYTDESRGVAQAAVPWEQPFNAPTWPSGNGERVVVGRAA